jgi:nitrite reductase/ring-hydroxylating ferredoxin subunit
MQRNTQNIERVIAAIGESTAYIHRELDRIRALDDNCAHIADNIGGELSLCGQLLDTMVR